MRLSVVIPCYNEVLTIPRLAVALDAAVANLREQGHDPEILVVDDGSSDGSVDALTKAAASRTWLRVIVLRRNFGQTAAMSAGFAHATGDVIIPMDADMQNDPADIPRLLAKLNEGYDVVSGWRRFRKDKLWTRKVPSKIANWLIGWVSGVRLHDYGCTMKAYRREVLTPVRLYGEMHRFIPIYAHWQGARVTELEVTHHPRLEGKSKYGLMRTFKVVLDLLMVKFLGSYSTKPLYFFGTLGALLCGAGTLAAIFTLYQKFIHPEHVWVHKNPLFGVAVFLFLVGGQAVMLGILAELQIRTYHESQAKPTYVIRQIINPSNEVPKA